MTYPADWNQPQPTAGREDVFAALLADDIPAKLRARNERGRITYGRTLETFNGRDAGQDAEEEVLDTLVYLRQMRLERGRLIELLFDAYCEMQTVATWRSLQVRAEIECLLGPDPDEWRWMPEAVAWDAGGSTEAMAELNSAWERVRR